MVLANIAATVQEKKWEQTHRHIHTHTHTHTQAYYNNPPMHVRGLMSVGWTYIGTARTTNGLVNVIGPAF